MINAAPGTIWSWDLSSAMLKSRIHCNRQPLPQAPYWQFYFDDKGTFISQINDSLNKVDNDYIIKLPFTQAVTNL